MASIAHKVCLDIFCCTLKVLENPDLRTDPVFDPDPVFATCTLIMPDLKLFHIFDSVKNGRVMTELGANKIRKRAAVI